VDKVDLGYVVAIQYKKDLEDVELKVLNQSNYRVGYSMLTLKTSMKKILPCYRNWK
jgi:hypothetical protein